MFEINQIRWNYEIFQQNRIPVIGSKIDFCEKSEKKKCLTSEIMRLGEFMKMFVIEFSAWSHVGTRLLVKGIKLLVNDSSK